MLRGWGDLQPGEHHEELSPAAQEKVGLVNNQRSELGSGSLQSSFDMRLQASESQQTQLNCAWIYRQ